MPKALHVTTLVWAAAIRRIASSSALVAVVATAAHGAPTFDDCPCRHAQAAGAPAPVARVARPTLLAVDATPGAGFVMTTDAVAQRMGAPPITAGRVVGETAAALGAGAVGGILTGSVAWWLGSGCLNDECTAGVIAGAFVGYTTFIAVAVKAVGSSGDQHVPFSYPFFGALAGAALGYPIFVHMTSGTTGGEQQVALALLLPPTGAVIGAIVGRRWDPEPVGSLRVLPPPQAGWDAATAPGPLPGARMPLASIAF